MYEENQLLNSFIFNNVWGQADKLEEQEEHEAGVSVGGEAAIWADLLLIYGVQCNAVL